MVLTRLVSALYSYWMEQSSLKAAKNDPRGYRWFLAPDSFLRIIFASVTYEWLTQDKLVWQNLLVTRILNTDVCKKFKHVLNETATQNIWALRKKSALERAVCVSSGMRCIMQCNAMHNIWWHHVIDGSQPVGNQHTLAKVGIRVNGTGLCRNLNILFAFKRKENIGAKLLKRLMQKSC
jgi:hypothetical protein